eukprot:c15153_g1_i1.p2 GENE.c15153_g1_i1~~c15153_g1_i1.p2  ORF type:complete len:123 (-),score=5.85 c15153_g1_i1:214-582(-)
MFWHQEPSRKVLIRSLFFRDKSHTHRVDTVALVCCCVSLALKDVAQVAIAPSTQNLNTSHAVAVVSVAGHRPFVTPIECCSNSKEAHQDDHKPGQPHPELNFASALYRGLSHPRQTKCPSEG